jgi:hypothetical protein
VRFARDNTRPTLGTRSGFEQALHVVAPPTVLAHTDTVGYFFLSDLGLWRVVFGILVVAALAALAWSARSRSRAVARLAFVALVVLAAGVVDGSNVPDGIESLRVNLYRWSWTAAFLTWTALGIGAVLLVGRVVGTHRIGNRVPQLAPVALIVIAAVIAASTVFTTGNDDHNRERPAFALEKRVSAAVLARIDRHRPVVITSDGLAASLSIAPYVLFRLVEAGVAVEVPKSQGSTYGSHRIYQPGSDTPAIVISSGAGKLPSVSGELITIERFAPARTALLDELSAEALGVKVEQAPGATALVDRLYPGLRHLYIDPLLALLPTDPRVALGQPAFLNLVLAGLLRSPAFDEVKVRRLLDLPASGNTIGRDEQVAVHIVEPDQIRDAKLPGL